MSHIHLPDGTLPLWIICASSFIVLMYLFFLTLCFKKNLIDNKKIPLVAVLASLMIVAISIELPFHYHLNLTGLTGIILGPVLAPVSILVVNTFVALAGHGGITFIPLNSIILSIEAILSFYLFNFIFKRTSKVILSSFFSVFISLLISAVITISVVYVGTKEIKLEEHEHHHEKAPIEHKNDLEHEEFNIKKFMLLLFSLGFTGWIMESTVSSFILSYINKVKPDLILHKK